MKKVAVPLLPDSLCLVSRWEEEIIPADPRANVSSPKRNQELLQGRHLMRKAVLQLTGHDPGWIGAGEDRLPQWPSNIRGTLSHSEGTVGVWIHQGPESLGLDLQSWLSADQAGKLREAAIKRGIRLPSLEETRLSFSEGMTLLFCIQESIQKCLGNRGLKSADLGSIRIEMLDSSSWRAETAENLRISGSWIRLDELCVTFGAL